MATWGPNARRVDEALKALLPGLSPFVETRMRGKHGPGWANLASRAQGGDRTAPLDAYGLLKTLSDNWRSTFEEAFGSHERFKVRNFVSTARDARNAIAHLATDLSDAEALRYLDAIHELLLACNAPASSLAAVKALYEAQRRDGLAIAAAAVATAAPPPIARPSLPIERAPARRPSLARAMDDGEAVSRARIDLWAGRPGSNVHQIIAVALARLPVSRHAFIREIEALAISRNVPGAIASLMTNAGNAYGRVFVEEDGRLRFHPDAERAIQAHSWSPPRGSERRGSAA